VHNIYTCVQGIYITIAINPNLLILAARIERQVIEGIFLIQHADIVIRKKDGAQPPNNVHDPSFSL
jgi:hypothetical protein